MKNAKLRRLRSSLRNTILSVPVRIKITGIILLTVIILGFSLNYWVTASLSDWLSFLLTDERVNEAMRAGGRGVTYVTLLAAAGSLVMASLLTYLLTRPLLDLQQMALKVADGQLDARAPVWANDEIGDVAVAINMMTDHLVASQNDLARTNRRLAAINQIMLAVEREDDIHDVLYSILQSLVTVMNLRAGWIYLRDPERDVFHLASWYNVPEEIQEFLLQHNQEAICRCQLDLIDGAQQEPTHIRKCQRLINGIQHTVLGQHMTIPIIARDQKYGVVNLLPDERYVVDEEALDLLSALGSVISESVANAWLRLKVREQELARQLLLESLVEAQEEERGRLARELHDGAGQMLTTLLVRIRTLEKKTTSPDLREDYSSLMDIVSETIDQIRELSYRLRPAALEEFGLAVALRALVEEMAAEADLEATCRLELDDVSLPPGVDVTLYRIAQEGLTNIVRHASANRVDAELSKVDQCLVMRIEDDGCGFSPHQLTAGPDTRHLGLIGMRERAAMAGGLVAVYSAIGQGTTIIVRVPLPEVAG